ncbi:MAG: type II toxin-antitoxin system VapC family toxin [Sphingomonadaceae bacterium]|nr:type II toxin-antitoxin system VapC family toxin [Sphingomonadaceae bacterium]
MIVVDASVAIKFVVAEPGSEEALAYVTSQELLVAPDWMLVEAANALFNKVETDALTRVQARANFDALPDFFGHLYPTMDLLDEATRLSFDLRHAVYDCLYLALAMRERTAVVTADREFVKAAKRGGLEPHVALLRWEQP